MRCETQLAALPVHRRGTCGGCRSSIHAASLVMRSKEVPLDGVNKWQKKVKFGQRNTGVFGCLKVCFLME
jgi:hypothetical protein